MSVYDYVYDYDYDNDLGRCQLSNGLDDFKVDL